MGNYVVLDKREPEDRVPDEIELVIDSASFVPYYEQIIVQIRAAIQRNALQKGAPFFTEGELAKKLGISKMPIKYAYRRLKSQGLLVTAKGRRPQIGAGSAPLDYQILRGFTEEVQARGGMASTKLLEISKIVANQEVASTLNLQLGELVYRIKRLRLKDSVPTTLETTHLPAAVFPELETHNLETRSLYSVIERDYSRQLSGAEERLSAITAEQEEASLLGIQIGFPLLVSQRLVYDIHNTVIEYGYSLIRADLYHIRVALRR